MTGHNSRVRLNEAYANGYAQPADDFGIGVLTGNNNVIEENTVSGNTRGIFIGAAARATLIRSNTVVGNPPIQVGISAPEPSAADIVNLSPAGETTFERNICVTAINAKCDAAFRRKQQ